MRTAGLLMAPLLFASSHVAAQPAEEGSSIAETRTPAPDPEEQASLELHLEHAVAQVSVPHAGLLLGRTNASRGYRLPGYGIVFVLTPRALPGGERAVFVFRGGSERTPSHVDTHARGGEAPDVAPAEVEEIEALERQVLILQHAAEAEHRAAEEDHQRIVRDVRIRLSPPGAHEMVELSEDDPDGAHVDETAPVAAPPGSSRPVPSSPPPWSFWFDSGTPQERRSADRVVEDVRGAVLDVLELPDAGVDSLGPDEFVTVAVDFVPGGLFASRSRPSRTLIVRVRQGDLRARARGTIGPEELRARIEMIEY